MRFLICGLLLMSFTIGAQTRVKENIKQQVVAVSEDDNVKPIRPVKQPPMKKIP